MKACGAWLASCWLKGSTMVWSTPQRASSVSLSRRVTMRAGAMSGLFNAAASNKAHGSFVGTAVGVDTTGQALSVTEAWSKLVGLVMDTT